MNIFYLDKNPYIAAKMSCDKHVCKMIIESAQMLSTAHRMLDGEHYTGRTKNGHKIQRWRLDEDKEDLIYKACHTGHPSTVWVMSNIFHYDWLYKHMIALNDEFKLRYNHTEDHMTIRKLKEVLRQPPKNIPINKIATDPTPAMPDECKIPGDVIGSYRKYYVMKKREFATWKAPAVVPEWYVNGVKDGEALKDNK
tara:strand:+ start:1343 stop:1930 length:588 start_codon:yes stop_codon:yes gene_type:complete